MATSRWKDVLDSLVVDGTITSINGSVFKQYEEQIGLNLPDDYKSYCQTFGPGHLTLPYHYCVYIPDSPSSEFDIDSRNKEIERWEAPSHVSFDLDQFKRAVFFASDITTSQYFWDPGDVTDRERHEYGIYVLHRSWKVERLCDTFWEFINDFCLSSGDSGHYNKEDVDLVFSPWAGK